MAHQGFAAELPEVLALDALAVEADGNECDDFHGSFGVHCTNRLQPRMSLRSMRPSMRNEPSGRHAPHVLRLEEGAGVAVGQIYDVDAAPAVGLQAAEGVVDVAHRDAHPRRGAEPSAAVGVGLRREFGHAVFGVDRLHAERRAQETVELLFGQLLAAALHAAGLHDHRVAQLRRMAFGQIPQRIAHAQQDFGLGVGRHIGQQPFVVVEVEAARAAAGDQAVDHIDQRRPLALQVVGQQPVEAPALRRAVETLESRGEAAS